MMIKNREYWIQYIGSILYEQDPTITITQIELIVDEIMLEMEKKNNE